MRFEQPFRIIPEQSAIRASGAACLLSSGLQEENSFPAHRRREKVNHLQRASTANSIMLGVSTSPPPDHKRGVFGTRLAAALICDFGRIREVFRPDRQQPDRICLLESSGFVRSPKDASVCFQISVLSFSMT